MNTPTATSRVEKLNERLTTDASSQDIVTALQDTLKAEKDFHRLFDALLLESLAQQIQISVPASRARSTQSQATCFAWLKEQTFVEPISSGRLRVDDVARDVFRASLWQENQPTFEHTHDVLARYFKAKSDQVVSTSTPTSEKYDNPDWREPCAEYLYHLSFTRQGSLQTIWLSHLLEANYLGKATTVHAPFQWLRAEYMLKDHPHLSYINRSFLNTLRPAADHG